MTFELFFRSTYVRLARGLLLLTGDEADAEDIAQETMVRVFERWDRIAGMESPEGYAFRVALNAHRKRQRRMRLDARRGQHGTEGVDPIGRAETQQLILDAVGRLTLEQRRALVLVDWLGVPTEEAARVLRIEPASVRSRLHRARGALREYLGDDHG